VVVVLSAMLMSVSPDLPFPTLARPSCCGRLGPDLPPQLLQQLKSKP
jgi:hypothetical protein